MPAEDTAGLPVPPPLIPLTGLLSGLLLGWLAPWPVSYVSWPLSLIALLLAVGLIGSAFAQLRWDMLPHHPTMALRTGGVLRLTRNPIYLGFVLVTAAAALAGGNAWLWLVVPLVMLALDRIIIAREERYLAGRFPTDYAAYRSRVRRWL